MSRVLYRVLVEYWDIFRKGHLIVSYIDDALLDIKLITET